MPKANRPINLQDEFLGQLPGLGRRNKKAVEVFLENLAKVQKNVEIILREKSVQDIAAFDFVPYQIVSLPLSKPRHLSRERFFTLMAYNAQGGNVCLLVRDDHQIFVAQHVYEGATKFHDDAHIFLILAGSVRNTWTDRESLAFDHFKMMKLVAEMRDFKKCLAYIKARRMQLKELSGK